MKYKIFPKRLGLSPIKVKYNCLPGLTEMKGRIYTEIHGRSEHPDFFVNRLMEYPKLESEDDLKFECSNHINDGTIEECGSDKGLVIFFREITSIKYSKKAPGLDRNHKTFNFFFVTMGIEIRPILPWDGQIWVAEGVRKYRNGLFNLIANICHKPR